jgi:ribosomal protein L40E
MGSAMRRYPEIAPLLKVGLPLAAVVAAAILGVTRGVATALLVLAASALLLAILALWNSIHSLDDQAELSLDEALALGAPSAEEEKKRAVLRALKDLEYERSVGKISEEDYLDLSTRYREEAKTLLRALAEAELPMRARVEKRLASRLRKSGLAEETTARAAPKPKSDDPESETISDPYEDDARAEAELDSEAETKTPSETETKICEECDTENDLDARFCKSCGAKQ